MRVVKVFAILFGILFLVIGVFFLIAAVSADINKTSRLIIGFILIGVSVVLFLLSRMKMEFITHSYEQKIDLSGDVDLETLKCNSCGGTLSEKNVTVQAGAVMVNCPYCGTAYQIKEAPKW